LAKTKLRTILTEAEEVATGHQVPLLVFDGRFAVDADREEGLHGLAISCENAESEEDYTHAAVLL